MTPPGGARLAVGPMMLDRSGAPAVADRSRAGRVPGVDRVRGLAIACMVADHACLVFGGPEVVRWTLGRLAVPLFFVLSGFLVSRLRMRHLDALLAGLWLPLLVPWLDAPNVLVWFVAGSVVLVGLRRLAPGSELCAVALVAAAGLTLAANGWAGWLPWRGSYNPVGLLGLMAVGRLLRVAGGFGVWRWADRLPSLLGVVGRYPLTVYAGHLLALQAVFALGFWRV